AWDVENDRFGGFFGAHSFTGVYIAFSKGAGKAHHACERLNVFLLVFSNPGEGSAVGLGLRAAMIAHRPSEKFPLFKRPTGWHGQVAQEAERSFLRSFSSIVGADAVQAGRGAQDAAHGVFVEHRSGVCSAQ